jgi:hypothetical protein
MLPFLTQLHFENTDITQKIIKGIDNLSRLREKDIESGVSPKAEVLNVKILRIVSKLCIGIGDTKFDQLMTLFSIDNGFYLGKTQRL